MKSFSSFFVFVMFFLQVSATQRIMYVDNFMNILGSPTNETKLFEFCKEYKINSIILYDLNKVHKAYDLTNKKQNVILAKFISRAKTEYGINQISASGETASFFIEVIVPYNNSRKSSNEKFDIFNLEYEYWNLESNKEDGYYCQTYLKKEKIPCNRAGTFAYFMNSLLVMKSLANESKHKVKVGVYVANYDDKEINEIEKYADRILVYDYTTYPDNLFHYIKERLDLLVNYKSKADIYILFSSEMNFIGKYLSSHTLDDIEKLFIKELLAEEPGLQNKINLKGFTYYTYGYLENSFKQHFNKK